MIDHGSDTKMGADARDSFAIRDTQTRYLKRFVLRRIKRRSRAQDDGNAWEREIARRFMECPSLENVHHLCLFYGYAKVRSTLAKVENAIFVEFFYGRIFLYPLWFKQFSKIFDAAKPRTRIRELLSSQD